MNTIFKSILIIGFLSLSSLANAGANTYYVTQNGNGAKDGKSLANAWAISNFNALSGGGYAGDTFYFSSTFTTRIAVNISGTSANPVTLDGYQTGDCDPLNSVCTSSALLEQGMIIYQTSYVIIQDFRITKTGDGNNPAFYSDTDGIIDHFIFRRNFINDTSCRGFQIGNSGEGDNHHIVIEENKVTDFAMRYVSPTGECTGFALNHVKNILIRNNIVGHDSPEDTDSACAGGCNTMTLHDARDILLEYNDIYGAPDQAGLSAKEGGHNSGHIYRFNKIHNNANWGIANSPHDTPPNDYFYIYANYVYDNGIVGIDNYDGADLAWYWSNLIINNGDSGFRTWDRGAGVPDYIYVINNTIAKNGITGPYHTQIHKGGIAFTDTGGTNYTVKNNLLYNNRTGVGGYHQIYDGGRNGEYQHNTLSHSSSTATWYYNGGQRSLAVMQGTYDRENDSIAGKVVDPGFTDSDNEDYTLDGSNINDGEDLSQCFYVNLSGGDSWFETKTGYSTLEVCLDDALDPNGTDWTTTPPTVAIVKRDTVGWSRGAYAYNGFGKPSAPPAAPDPIWIVK